MNEQEIKQVADTIVAAMQGALGDKWQEAALFAESEAAKFADGMAEIALWQTTGKITKEQGKVLRRMRERSIKMVLTALEGISLVMAERAVNAAIKAVGGMVNTMIGWKLF